MSDEHITIQRIADNTGITKSTVDRYIADLKDIGVISREGSTKSGCWKINEEFLNE